MKNGQARERFKLNLMQKRKRKIVDRKGVKMEIEGKLRAVGLFKKSPFLINLERENNRQRLFILPWILVEEKI